MKNITLASLCHVHHQSFVYTEYILIHLLLCGFLFFFLPPSFFLSSLLPFFLPSFLSPVVTHAAFWKFPSQEENPNLQSDPSPAVRFLTHGAAAGTPCFSFSGGKSPFLWIPVHEPVVESVQRSVYVCEHRPVAGRRVDVSPIFCLPLSLYFSGIILKSRDVEGGFRMADLSPHWDNFWRLNIPPRAWKPWGGIWFWKSFSECFSNSREDEFGPRRCVASDVILFREVKPAFWPHELGDSGSCVTTSLISDQKEGRRGGLAPTYLPNSIRSTVGTNGSIRSNGWPVHVKQVTCF